ncbi:MAG: hypothetical protein Q8Q15_01895, partial [bacterium]|nr:hypothetical protein [bacterium]
TMISRPSPARGAASGGAPQAVDLARIATFLGITTDELKTQLTGGKSLLDIATGKGKTATDLVTLMLAPWKEHLQINVKYGNTSQAEEDAMYQLRAVRTGTMISRPSPARGAASGGAPRGMRFKGVPGGGMMGGGKVGANTQ